MSGTFKGFTEKDISKMKNKKDVEHPLPVKNVNKKVTPQRQKLPVSVDSVVEKIDDKAKLHRPVNDVNMNQKPKIITENSDSKVDSKPSTPPPEVNGNCDVISNEEIKDNSVPVNEVVTKIEKIKFEEFQIHQKLIEEQNRRRKEMLSKALEDREKQTVEESLRLEKIKNELKTLDAQLSDDVSILRKEIDKCSLSYMEAEKSYHKIEMEFLAAKLLLQKEKERKELLTEHLCTLIAHNEDRKAKKLESLMDELVYNKTQINPPNVSDGVCEKTGKMLEIIDGKVILNDD